MKYLNLPFDLKELAYAIAQEADHTEIRVFVNAICDASMEWELDAAICSDRLKVMQVEASVDNEPMPSNEEIMKMYPPL